MRTTNLLTACMLFAMLACRQINALAQEEEKLFKLSLEELLGVKIVTATRSIEKAGEAPATVIVLTRDDLQQRGYTDLTEIFDDLPGMDIARANGDITYKNYWRGFRNTIGFPFLVMIDGVILNSLNYNEAEILGSYPLSNVRQVEVVYGPASAVYGSNAFMGVVNVITLKDRQASGSFIHAALGMGSNQSKIADLNFFYKKDDLRLSLTGRFDYGEMDQTVNENYEYTKNKYYADRRLWGGIIDNRRFGGRYSSPHKNRAADLRAYLGNTELAAQYLVQENGYGNEYAGDRAQNYALWAEPELSLYLRHAASLAPKIHSATLARYRESGISPYSYFVEGYGNPRVVDFSYYKSFNRSWSAFQDFEFKPDTAVVLNAGIKYENSEVRNVEVVFGPSFSPDSIDARTYPFPPIPSGGVNSPTIVVNEQQGFYVQGKFPVGRWLGAKESHFLHLGWRWDKHSTFGVAKTLRAGYVGRFGAFTGKLLYGEGFQEPTPRALYSGWAGTGFNPTLEPETSKTLEANLSYGRAKYLVSASLFKIKNEKTIFATAGGAKNLGDRDVVGLDLSWHTLLDISGLRQFKVWGYYSYIQGEEETFDAQNRFTGNLDIGDLAEHKLWFGGTAVVDDRLTATLLGRYIGKRTTVMSNPVREVDGYLVVDANIVVNSIGAGGLGFSLRVKNLFNTQYFHPGVRDANAGNTPGQWKDGIVGGQWIGSKGFFSSLLPQPGRSFLAMLTLR